MLSIMHTKFFDLPEDIYDTVMDVGLKGSLEFDLNEFHLSEFRHIEFWLNWKKLKGLFSTLLLNLTDYSIITINLSIKIKKKPNFSTFNF